VLLTDSEAVRTGRRSFEFIPIAIVLFGLAMFIAGVALFNGVFDQLVTTLVFGAASNTKTFASAVIFLAAFAVVANLKPALRSLRLGESRHADPSLTSRVCFDSHGHKAAAAELVALKLSEPESGLVSEITMKEAVRRAYEQSEGTAAACFANSFADGPDDIVKMYATFIAEHVPVYGCKRPSSAVEQVFLSAPLKEFDIEHGAVILRERHGPALYDRLRINAADYPVVLKRLRSGS
jgi:hypothetical protein